MHTHFCSCNSFTNFIAGVHDSYWTHACDVDEMNRILREKFVELYEAPILENVSISTLLRCSNSAVHSFATYFISLSTVAAVHALSVLLLWGSCYLLSYFHKMIIMQKTVPPFFFFLIIWIQSRKSKKQIIRQMVHDALLNCYLFFLTRI